MRRHRQARSQWRPHMTWLALRWRVQFGTGHGTLSIGFGIVASINKPLRTPVGLAARMARTC